MITNTPADLEQPEGRQAEALRGHTAGAKGRGQNDSGRIRQGDKKSCKNRYLTEQALRGGSSELPELTEQGYLKIAAGIHPGQTTAAGPHRRGKFCKWKEKRKQLQPVASSARNVLQLLSEAPAACRSCATGSRHI